MVLQKKDFIEIDFTGKVKDGEIFDSTTKEDLENLHKGHGHEQVEALPFIFCLGEGMFLKAIDDFLIGKQPGSVYEIELKPEQAFGPRSPQLIQTIPMKIFREKNINPVQGASFNFDGRVGRVLSVSGGRVMVDFNHFLSGKTLSYKVKILRKVEDLNEKIDAFNDFFFRKKFPFEIKENSSKRSRVKENSSKRSRVKEKTLILEVEKPFVKLVELFKDKFKEMLGLDLEIKEIKEAGEKQAEEIEKVENTKNKS